MKTLTSRQLILIATLVSVVSILGAWTFESLGYAPCKLCYYQRYPHYAAIVIGALALVFGLRWLAWAGALAAAITSGIGFFHTGVERKWWPGPASCSGQDVAGMSTQDLLAQITEAPLVRCDEIPWRLSDLIPWDVLDLSMANFNAVGSLVLVFIWIAAARRA
ncbi:disulfide bond formation protein B [Maritimibacter fusiformis]|uniref:Disulfide bond formation protein B n=1 Tax=Maritimibacter fusiformis TaxID=2603819 RepID=A0A5D0RPL6_9RHOB|nr:disulfide bond formation protein B [Maritimibacter fusiformis]TYB83453.1 disulfide bond formation protein B [Maritimibacter fusiformis]